MKSALKQQLLKIRGFEYAWTLFRSAQLNREYMSRREYYRNRANALKLTYSLDDTSKALKKKFTSRGYNPKIREIGKIHTFAFIPDLGWHKSLLPDLKELGSVTWYDYVKEGYTLESFFRRDKEGLSQRRLMNQAFVEYLVRTHEKNPIDWLFVYASGVEISSSSIESIQKETGIPTVCMCLDDKQSWTGPWMGDHPAGQIALAPVFDLSWTSARVACEWYLVEGGRPVLMPEGFSKTDFKPINIEKDIPISFVGAKYGFRERFIEKLRSYNIPVQTFGTGWANTGWVNDVNEIFNRSKINLGIGGIGYLEKLMNLKGRDFEIPGAGGGAYLTIFNPDLAEYFQIGKEIMCYNNEIDAVESIRNLMANTTAADELANAALKRSLAEHRWLHRYIKILQVLGILE